MGLTMGTLAEKIRETQRREQAAMDLVCTEAKTRNRAELLVMAGDMCAVLRELVGRGEAWGGVPVDHIIRETHEAWVVIWGELKRESVLYKIQRDDIAWLEEQLSDPELQLDPCNGSQGLKCSIRMQDEVG